MLVTSLVSYPNTTTDCNDAKEVIVFNPVTDDAGDGHGGRGEESLQNSVSTNYMGDGGEEGCRNSVAVNDIVDEDGVRGEEGGQSSVAIRWPRQETLALLKIRSDMDIAFKESTLKGPLWEAISRKLAELGYCRSAKKCKEKFENIYKYHKRTKERAARVDGKPYRFSNQLEAIDSRPSLPPLSFEIQIPNPIPISTTVLNVTPTNPADSPQANAYQSCQNIYISEFISTSLSPRSSLREKSGYTKRKWSTFFENLIEEVVRKQEIFQNQFLKTLERLEHEHMAREEAWKTQEMERLNREHETLVEERLAATTRNAAVIAFLEKVSEQKDSPLSMERTVDNLHLDKGRNFIKMSCSRWPKAEVQALIVLRSDLEHRYQGNIPKGSLWEEISAAMRRFGYNRSAKRCKEKWENINKYFRKVKESNKMRPEDSKTCPYFHQLEALYKDKMDKIDKALSPSYGLKAEDLVMHMTNQYRHQSESLRLEHMGLDLAAEDLRSENDHENGDAEDVYENVINNPSSRTIAE